ncbi:hypothetical protein PIB30_007771 [Stylosanthes scabra]|uniref:RRM domain-containing protein n=1 Tax=Stylosanthes scabra TaxID=79078 RepID=A0ABU6Z3C2_9FABA|nr:hypothetical protein [Stylosanthes scabra]
MKWRTDEATAVTVFMDNLPRNTTVGWLWKTFGKEGRVVNVFLSRKERKWNPLRFAFVRFKTKHEAATAIQRFDGWSVWDCHLKLSESKFRRRGEGVLERREPRPSNTHEAIQSYQIAVMNTLNKEPILRVRDDNAIQTLGNSKLDLKADEGMKEVMSQSLVGEAPRPFQFSKLKSEVMKDCQTVIDMKMMGSWKAVMIFDSVKNMMAAEESALLLNHFIEIRRWLPGEVNRTRRFWLEFNGLPGNAWTIENMERIGNVWGTVIRVDKGKGDHFNAFRVLVDAKISPMIQASLL